MNASQCIARLEALKAERSNLDGHFDLIDRFIVPGRGRLFDGKTGGENSVDWRRRELFDSTALQAAQTLAASINGSLTSPSTRWFTYRFRNPENNKNTVYAAWLQECQDKVFYSLYSSSFSVEASEFYLDAVTFGTPCMLHEHETPSPGDVCMRFKTLSTRDFWFETDFAGKPIALYQEKEYTAQQIAIEFEEPLPENVAKALKNPTHTSPFVVVHVIYLDHDKMKTYKKADPSKKTPPDNRPFQEKFVLEEGAEELTSVRPSAYYEMAAYILKWGRTAGSKYGYSPAINSLPDVLTLNELKEIDLRAREKAVDPPLITQMRGVLGDVDYQAGGVTVVRDMGMIQPLNTGARIDLSVEGIAMLRGSIRELFFVDQLELKDSPAMTATEVNVRYELMQRLLGPTLARFKTDFLDPLLHRSFWIMYREGALPQMPDGLNPSDIDIEYVGPMARNQHMDEVVAIERIAQSMQILAPLDEEVLDTYDWAEAARLMGDRLGVPAKIMNSKQKVKTKQDARAKQQAEAARMQQMESMGKTMRDGAQGAKALSDAGLEMGDLGLGGQ